MRQCSICGKGSIMRQARKKLRGHYNPTPKKRKYPNLQTMTIPGKGKVSVCAQCIKTLSKTK